MEYRYLFKAKRIDNGEWVEGQYVNTCYPKDCKKTGHFIVKYPNHLNEIYTSTICQCTGLKDKNGKLIWENDIVKDLFSDACAQIKYGSYQSYFDSTKTEHVGFYIDWSGKYIKRYRKDLGYWINVVNADVIGNIFDNPDLLESEE